MIWLLLLALGIAAALPFVLERRKPDMTPQLRTSLPGQFAMLSDGHTHFQWHGPEDGPVLVCIHGLTTPSFVWEPLLPGLTQAGFRVLTYDLYGRGCSDRPSGAQTRSFFIRQLRDLLDHQGVEGPMTVMGYSMGGSIATIFAAEEPDRVSQLILLAPTGIEYRPTRFAEIARTSGYTGLWMMLAYGGFELRQVAKAMPGPKGVSEKQIAETRWRGYLPAVLSSQRHLLTETLEEEHKDLAMLDVPTMAIWGEADTVIPISAMGKLAQWNRSAKQASVTGASHALGITHPIQVLEKVADLLEA